MPIEFALESRLDAGLVALHTPRRKACPVERDDLLAAAPNCGKGEMAAFSKSLHCFRLALGAGTRPGEFNQVVRADSLTAHLASRRG